MKNKKLCLLMDAMLIWEKLNEKNYYQKETLIS